MLYMDMAVLLNWKYELEKSGILNSSVRLEVRQIHILIQQCQYS